MAGVQLPIEAARRTVFVLSCPEPLPQCPLLIDPSGWWLRPEGRFLITGAEPLHTEPGLPLEPNWAEWNDEQWASLAHRIPALAALRVERAWAGYYEMNTFDHNAVIGPHPSCATCISSTGFQATACSMRRVPVWHWPSGCCWAKRKTIDVQELGFERLVQNRRCASWR
jgi:FAD-dependent oxidoreductase domain-containing protein 1